MFVHPVCIWIISFFLDVPQSVLSLGSNLNGSNIKEGDDVYFECSVRANPKPYKISWRFNVSSVMSILDYNFNVPNLNWSKFLGHLNLFY